MFIIPVIDLLNGSVVHAKHGDRANYQRLQSQLTNSSDPLIVADTILAHFACQHLYIADLNAIQKLPGHHLKHIQQIAQQHPEVTLWVDAGIANIHDLANWSDHHFNLILGSENFASLDNFCEVSSSLNAEFILSLDFMPSGYRGPIELIQNTQHWPKRVILMSLAKVGSNAGMDLHLLKQFETHANMFDLFVAGGVRSREDLNILEQRAIRGALVASALHNRQILPADTTA